MISHSVQIVTAGCARYEKRTVHQGFLRFNIHFTNGLPILGRARLAKYIQTVEIHLAVGCAQSASQFEKLWGKI